MSLMFCLRFAVCECERKFKERKKIVLLSTQALHNIYKPFFRMGGTGFLHRDTGGIF